MKHWYHKLLLHRRRAGASASRCWLPVQYREVDALDKHHRPSHHPLKGPKRGVCHHPGTGGNPKASTKKRPTFVGLLLAGILRELTFSNAHKSVCGAATFAMMAPEMRKM
jgi:hypothetical protein